MFVKELCWKCFEENVAYSGTRADFEKIWKRKMIWCPKSPFGRNLKIIQGSLYDSVLGANLRFKSKVPEECPYLLEHIVNRHAK